MAIKSLDEINKSFYEEIDTSPADTDTQCSNSGTGAVKVISDILFYIAMLIIFYCVLSVGDNEGNHRGILGYSSFVVISSSMKGEIDKGALIITAATEPGKLKIGDNITFVKDSHTTVTHKIVDIIEADGNGTGNNHGDSNSNSNSNINNAKQRQFQTKGVNNVNPDEALVDYENIIGKVIIVLPRVGAFINGLSENLHLLLIILLLCSLLSFLLRTVTVSKKCNGGNRR